MSKATKEANPFSADLFDYRESGSKFLFKSLSHAAAGLALGLAIDKLCNTVQNSFNVKAVFMIIIQITLIILILYIIQQYISKDYKYSLEWQNTTPGLFFPGLLFGVQGTLYTNIKTTFNA
jgi:hypothetical protein